MSLSQEPANSYLKKYFVCGYTDITNESYAGVSGRHERQGQATNTTNGAGPHNLQLFMLASDGTVLHCLPGYWNPQDLVREMTFAYQLNKVYADTTLRKSEKDKLFKQMQLSHIDQHPPQMTRRSHMQGFDQQYEMKYKLHTSDTILDPELAQRGMAANGHPPGEAFKTCDVIMHERMSKRPFLSFHRFDTANFVDYGKPRYDKNEDQIDAYSGREVRDHHDTPTIGELSQMDRITKEHQAAMEKPNKNSPQWGDPSGSSQWGAGQPSSNTGWGNRQESSQSASGWGNTTQRTTQGWGGGDSTMKKKTSNTAWGAGNTTQAKTPVNKPPANKPYGMRRTTP